VEYFRTREKCSDFAALNSPANHTVVERFILSMKQECTRCLLVPLSRTAMRREIRLYATWYNAFRPHMSLGGM
jgi:transposase InsO family protein